MRKNMKKIIHSPIFWISATMISGVLYYFSFHCFSKTFPIVHLSITMNLEQALVQAQVITQQNNFGPSDYQSAATFHTDETTKTFVELEAGGKDAFVAMMNEKLYMPYTWNVRHFKEFEKNEVLLKFTPDGTPYGFIETLSEDIPGVNLSEQEAEKIAQEHAVSVWNITFEHYNRVEASLKEQPSKRIDHTFVYERTDTTIGEGLYRLKIYVSGDKVTEITHFVKIPEAFYRRYAHMRSANHGIALAATLLMGLLYILGGCGLGLFFIFKKRWHMWKQPLMWGIILGGSQVLTQINSLPSRWMYYTSAYSSHNFLIQLFLSFFTHFLFTVCAMTIIIMAAESLTRYAFGNHPQLWSLWIPRNAASYAVLSRTWGSYLLVGFMCAFVVSFYLITTHYLGWWTPSDILFNPNVLATYAPWFSPLARSLNAGFMEECLFRAIPLAGAAIIGNHYGKRNLFVGVAFIVQALIFGAAHANYPTQPSYARLIELIIPSFIFGFTYLRFGLLPGIITHVVYDLIWFSIPIFVSTGSDTLFSKLMIIIIGSLPLLIIAYARMKHGGLTLFDENHINIHWKPAGTIAQTTTLPITVEKNIPQKTHLFVIIATCAALVALFFSTPFTHDGVIIHETQQEMVEKADTFLKSKNIPLSHPWQKMPLFFTSYTTIPSLLQQHIFIWREGKKELYHKLLSTYLEPAHWTVRYAQFEGDLIQRTEEHKIAFYDTTRHYHQLPESLEGTSLTKDEAQKIAYKTLHTTFNISAADIEEISAQEQQLPHRKNWFFIFADKNSYPLEKGQARIKITISGDEVIDTARFIHVPEEWERNELNNNHKLGIIGFIHLLLLVLLFIIAIMYAHKENISYALSPKLFVLLFFIITSLLSIDLINSWPSIVGSFNTSEPWNTQLFQRLAMAFFGLFLKALSLSFIMSYCVQQLKIRNQYSTSTLITGYGLGFIMAALTAVGKKIMPHAFPLWPNYDPLGTTVPLLDTIIKCLIAYAQTTAYYSLFFIVINQATQHWQKNKLLFSVLLILCGFLVPLQSLEALPLWLIINICIGIIVLLIYICVIRYNSTIIPLVTASLISTHVIQQGIFNAYPYAWLAAMINVCIIISVSFIWFKTLHKKDFQ